MQVNATADRLGELCSELVRRLRLLERTETACCGIPLSRALVLQTLHGSEEARRMSEVAAALGVAQSTATRLVDPLVREGLVQRGTAAEDGRVVFVSLTSRGRRAAAELVRAARGWSERLLERIAPDQRETVVVALERVVVAVNSCCASAGEATAIQSARAKVVTRSRRSPR